MPLPLEYLDRLRHERGLSLVEQDVFTYILRRTWGYRKRADYIALSQFTDGLRDADGHVVDYGCCTKRRQTVLAATARLAAHGLIAIVPGKGTRPSHYTVLLPPPAGISLADGPAAPSSEVGGEAHHVAVRPDHASGPAGNPPAVRSGHASGPVAVRPAVRLADQQQNTSCTPKPTQTHDDDDGRACARAAHQNQETDTGRGTATAVDASTVALVAAGLHKTVARHFAAHHTPEYIGQAIAYVVAGARAGRIDRPGGYLYRILEQGRPIPLPRTQTSPASAPASARPCSAAPSAGQPPQPTRDTAPDTTIWAQVQAEVSLGITPANYARWLAPTCGIRQTDDVLTVQVPDAFHAHWMSRLEGHVRSALRRLKQPDLRIDYVPADAVTQAAAAPLPMAPAVVGSAV